MAANMKQKDVITSVEIKEGVVSLIMYIGAIIAVLILIYSMIKTVNLPKGVSIFPTKALYVSICIACASVIFLLMRMLAVILTLPNPKGKLRREWVVLSPRITIRLMYHPTLEDKPFAGIRVTPDPTTMSGLFNRDAIASAWSRQQEFYTEEIDLQLEEPSIEEVSVETKETSRFLLKTFAMGDPRDQGVQVAILHIAEFACGSLHPCNMRAKLTVNGRPTFIASVAGGWLD